MVEEYILSVLHSFPEMPFGDILTYNIGSTDSPGVLFCPLNSLSAAEKSHIMLLIHCLSCLTKSF